MRPHFVCAAVGNDRTGRRLVQIAAVRRHHHETVLQRHIKSAGDDEQHVWLAVGLRESELEVRFIEGFVRATPMPQDAILEAAGYVERFSGQERRSEEHTSELQSRENL